MTALVWDQVGDRVYQAGVDRGVLYLPDSSGVAWNGLVSLTEQSNQEVKPFYLDGVKYLETHVPGDFSAELIAITYPDEFDEINGIASDGEGMFFHDQRPKPFGLSYRTLVGDDVEGTARGYKIHILYNLMANPSTIAYASLNDQINPIAFTWTISGIPAFIPGRKPTSHISIDSTKIDPDILAILEAKLYGTAGDEPALPTIAELLELAEGITIIDHGDGTWSAVGSDDLIHMLDATTFEIIEADAIYLDADTYEISSSEG